MKRKMLVLALALCGCSGDDSSGQNGGLGGQPGDPNDPNGGATRAGDDVQQDR